MNACTQPHTKTFNEGMDCLIGVMRRFHELTGKVPHLFKADIDSAYRRVPIRADHRWAAGVVFLHQGIAVAAQHLSMPFGATSAVHAWDRVAKLILKVARVLLCIQYLPTSMISFRRSGKNLAGMQRSASPGWFVVFLALRRLLPTSSSMVLFWMS